jgi:hypothetical protein
VGSRFSSDGALYDAGKYGDYWSSTKYDSSHAYDLVFYNNGIEQSFYYRWYGFIVRAVAEN